MVKANRLYKELNLFLPCSGQLVAQPAGLASLNHCTGTVLNGRGQLGST